MLMQNFTDIRENLAIAATNPDAGGGGDNAARAAGRDPARQRLALPAALRRR